MYDVTHLERGEDEDRDRVHDFLDQGTKTRDLLCDIDCGQVNLVKEVEGCSRTDGLINLLDHYQRILL